MIEIGLQLEELGKGGRDDEGVLGGKGVGVKNFFLHPNKLLIWACPENLAGICQGKAEILMIFQVRVRFGFGFGFGSVQSDYIENLSIGFGFG